MTLSVIVPVYNVEKYIGRCLDSLLAQNFDDFECIIIDDGSKDGTLEICRQYADKDQRIKVFHIENEGVSHARNLGMEFSEGEYITFVDGDDYVEKETYSSVFGDSSYQNYEVFCYGMKKLSDRSRHISFRNKGLEYNYIHYDVYMHAVCNKVFRRSFLERIAVQFDTGTAICEDMLVSFKALALASDVKYIEGDYYCYCDNEESVSHKEMSLKSLADYKKVARLVEDFCTDNHMEKKYKKFINYRKMYYAVIYLTSVKYYNPMEYRKENPFRKVWTYTFRPDLLILTLCSNFHFDLPAYIYTRLKEKKYKNS